jgi:hypothetical protein
LLQQRDPPSQLPTELSQGTIVDLAKPAVVQVISYSFGLVSVNDWGIVDSLMEEEEIITHPHSSKDQTQHQLSERDMQKAK